MKKLHTINSLLLIFFVTVFALYSCNNAENKKSETNTEAIESTEIDSESVVIANKEYPIPTAFEVTKMINQAGAGYIYDLCNNVENVNKYFTEKEKAINLGIYGADLSYSSTYQKKQETMLFLEASKKLIDDLNVTTAINKELVDIIEKNIDNKDTLISLITDSFYDTYEFLTNNGKDDLSVFVITGSWIEGLYIATQVTINSAENADFKEVIAAQAESLNELLSIMEGHKDNEDIAKLFAKLQTLKAEFEKIGDIMTDEQLESIIAKAEKLRNELI